MGVATRGRSKTHTRMHACVKSGGPLCKQHAAAAATLLNSMTTAQAQCSHDGTLSTRSTTQLPAAMQMSSSATAANQAVSYDTLANGAMLCTRSTLLYA